MPVSKEFEAYVVDQLSVAGFVSSRRMFGGVGLYVDDVFCALIDRSGQVYLRVGDTNRADFEAEGMQPFQPRATGGTMPYFELPARVLEDPAELREWTLKARAAAVAARPDPMRSNRKRRR